MSEIANGKQREKEAQRQNYDLPEKRCHFHGTTMYIILDIPHQIPSVCSCQLSGLWTRTAKPAPVLARSGTDSAGQILPRLFLLIFSTTCLTSDGPETSNSQSVMMHRTKHTLPHSLLQLFSLQVPLKTKSRKHLQSAAGRKNAHRGQICTAKRYHFSLHLC